MPTRSSMNGMEFTIVLCLLVLCGYVGWLWHDVRHGSYHSDTSQRHIYMRECSIVSGWPMCEFYADRLYPESK